MKILIDKKFEQYSHNLKSNNGKISFTTGETLNISKDAYYIVPGFIDQHIHGSAGVDTMDAKDLEIFAKSLLKEGTTAFTPTTMTFDLTYLQTVMDNVNEYMNSANQEGAQVIGVHVEGPFISKKFIGAQNPEYVHVPSVEAFELLNKHKIAKEVTLAPELDDNFELTKYLSANNIIASAGHTAATYAECENAIENGLNCFTHLHNASTGHHHREPGVVSAAFSLKNVAAELIVDGIHIHPDAVKTTYNIKGWENINLITDAIRAKGMPDGEYDLGGQPVFKKGSEARLADGTLAGSVLEMNQAIKNMYNFSGCEINEAFLMASYNPAQLLGLNTKGLIIEGNDCDIAVLDQDFNVLQTFIDGQLKYEKEGV